MFDNFPTFDYTAMRRAHTHTLACSLAASRRHSIFSTFSHWMHCTPNAKFPTSPAAHTAIRAPHAPTFGHAVRSFACRKSTNNEFSYASFALAVPRKAKNSFRFRFSHHSSHHVHVSMQSFDLFSILFHSIHHHGQRECRAAQTDSNVF